MDKQATNTVINLINGLECHLMRQTFLKLQEDENSTNEQLVDDATKWNTFLDSYCALYRKTNPNIPVH
jgi:hypothetical protein